MLRVKLVDRKERETHTQRDETDRDRERQRQTNREADRHTDRAREHATVFHRLLLCLFGGIALIV